MQVGPLLQEAIHSGRALVGEFLDRRWNNYPLGRRPRATADDYLELFENTKSKSYPEVEKIEAATGFAIDRSWVDDLALHTQIVKKKSELAYTHGRLIYSLLRQRIQNENRIIALETGTARGFSALCMAKAMDDAGVDGSVISLDVLPHQKEMFWNCVDDAERAKTRADLLAPWSDLLRRVIFVQGDTRSTLPKINVQRLHFVFLDAQHLKSSVLHEFSCVSVSQRSGDVVFFDDVTPSAFPGVVAAVDEIEAQGQYRVIRIQASEQRGYAWAVKT
jgi:predicted O-methyltransferase YrrM